VQASVDRGERSGDGVPTVAVVGGGIAGLAAAWWLATSDIDARVVVLEADRRFGGKLQSAEIGGRRVDTGPDAFVARRPEAVDLCRQVGLGDELVAPGARSAYVWARGRLRPLPPGLALGVPTRLWPLAKSGIVSPVGVGRAAADLLGRPRAASVRSFVSDVAVDDVVRRRLGRQVADRLSDPLVGGIHAGPTRTLSAAAVFPALLDADRRGGSLMRALRSASPAAEPLPTPTGAPGGDAPVFLTVRGGLSRLVDQLVGSLRQCGVEVRAGAAVDALERLDRRQPSRWSLQTPGGAVHADAVVLATPAGSAGRLLSPFDHELGQWLVGIEYAGVALVTLRLPASAVDGPLAGSGLLVPVRTRRLITACTWLSSKWPSLGRPDDVLLRASVGRYGDDRWTGLSDDALVARVMADLGAVMGLRGHPLEAVVTRWPDSFPQYAVGHLDRVAAIEARVTRLDGVAIAGAALHGVGIPACIASGRRAAAAAAASLAEAGHAEAGPEPW